MQYGCKCDQGYRGADCSLIECPSKQDPLDDKCRTGITVGTASPSVTVSDITNFQLQYAVATGNTGWNVAYSGDSLTGPNKFRQGNTVYACYGSMSGQDCSGRGICNYASGTCTCTSGYGGTACEIVASLS
jgi:hypothetical protein